MMVLEVLFGHSGHFVGTERYENVKHYLNIAANHVYAFMATVYQLLMATSNRTLQHIELS